MFCRIDDCKFMMIIFKVTLVTLFLHVLDLEIQFMWIAHTLDTNVKTDKFFRRAPVLGQLNGMFLLVETKFYIFFSL